MKELVMSLVLTTTGKGVLAGGLSVIPLVNDLDSRSEGVHYFEVRFAPQLLATRVDDIDIVTVLRCVNDGLKRGKSIHERDRRLERLTEGKVPQNCVCWC